MVREDPSLVVEVDEESGQTVLKGIGELHLEVRALQLLHREENKKKRSNMLSCLVGRSVSIVVAPSQHASAVAESVRRDQARK